MILKIRILLIRDKVIGEFTIVQAVPIRFKATNLSPGANCEFHPVVPAEPENSTKAVQHRMCRPEVKVLILLWVLRNICTFEAKNN